MPTVLNTCHNIENIAKVLKTLAEYWYVEIILSKMCAWSCSINRALRMLWKESTERKRDEGREREEEERRELIELSLYSYYSNYNESTTTARGCTPVTLTVEEPRKICVLFYLFHCTHIVYFTTKSLLYLQISKKAMQNLQIAIGEGMIFGPTCL